MTTSEGTLDIPGRLDTIPCLQVNNKRSINNAWVLLNYKIMLVVPISSARPGVSIDVLKILILTPATPAHKTEIKTGSICIPIVFDKLTIFEEIVKFVLGHPIEVFFGVRIFYRRRENC